MCEPLFGSSEPAQPSLPPPPPTRADDEIRTARSRFLFRSGARFGLSSSVVTGARGSRSGRLLPSASLGGGSARLGFGPTLSEAS